ncbi:hypothetical protein ACFC0M_06495 [Streptomyces sp. NPDC056149]|uniref:hypothetical protein n=1 Tax=Streptomyces sp. NPDC056149 TaxID=3345728 RepID=UPI0035DAF069
MSNTGTQKPSEQATIAAPGRKDALQSIVTLLGLLGLLLTAIEYWAADRYFAQFGVTPEEVGLDTTVLLTRVATMLVFFGFLVVPILMFWPGVLILGVEPNSSRGRLARFLARAFRDRPGLRTLTLSALVGFGWVVVSLVEGPSVILSDNNWVLVWFMGTLIAAPGLHLIGRPRALGPLLRLCLVVFLVASFCMISLGDTMERRGTRAVESAQTDSLAYAIGVRPQYVHADFPNASGTPKHADGPMLYLGQASGIQVLYDCATKEVIRKPSTQVQLTSSVGFGQDHMAWEVQATCHRPAAPATASR